MENLCLYCGEKLVGRIDKKFCSDQCRTTYYNQINKDTSNYMRRINYILRKNRRILAELNPDGKAKTHKDTLLNRGFNFKFFTNVYKTKTGNTYFFNYDQGYMMLDHGYIMIVSRMEPV
ncbi:MAG TPA: hypothetical protein DDY13_13555 [Cytophagales bacterium]|mgnify:CR=1 FL=1|jgi:predicted nucleic acid-binding Zn ribbon protein|nr:hypothetical protein [Cytophagales bacterium]